MASTRPLETAQAMAVKASASLWSARATNKSSATLPVENASPSRPRRGDWCTSSTATSSHSVRGARAPASGRSRPRCRARRTRSRSARSSKASAARRGAAGGGRARRRPSHRRAARGASGRRRRVGRAVLVARDELVGRGAPSKASAARRRAAGGTANVGRRRSRVAPRQARPGARVRPVDASLSRATNSSAAALRRKRPRRGATPRGGTANVVRRRSRVAPRGGGARPSGWAPAKPRARLDTRSAVGDRLRRSSTRRGARPWSSYPLRALKAPRGNASNTANVTKDVTNMTKTTCRARRFISSDLLSVRPGSFVATLDDFLTGRSVQGRQKRAKSRGYWSCTRHGEANSI